MPEPKRDTRIMLRQIHRNFVEVNLGLAEVLDHFGLPQVSHEQIEKVLAEEGVTHPVKSPFVAPGHLSTGGPSVHRPPRTTRPMEDEV